MAIRVYKLAKELGVTSKDIMAEAQNHGITVQNHMGSLSEAEANMIRAFLYKPPAPEEKKPEPVPAKKAEPVVQIETEPEATVADESATPVESTPAPEAEPTPATVPEVVLSGLQTHTKETSEIPAATAQVSNSPAKPLEMPIGAPISDEEVGADDQPAEDTGTNADAAPPELEVRHGPAIAPAAKTVVSSPLASETSQKKAKALPPRRTATILGRKELPVDEKPPARSAPVVSSEGMTQVGAVGSKRTFVRSPQRGGGPRYGGGGPRGRGRGGPRGMMPPRPKSKTQTPVERPGEIEIQLPITVKDLAAAMAVKTADIIKKLMGHDMFAKINDTLDKDTVEVIGLEFECVITVGEAETLEDKFVETEVESFDDIDEDIIARPPTVAMLGHVDHGKTSLLDNIRQSRVAEREHGGITQHTGASRVSTPHGDIVFLDTPGHKAFTEMRARGANVTDIVVLVVAADDGVMPQTEEAIAHARAAETPIVVAINKCDKHDANIDRVKQQLAGIGLQVEDWGGETLSADVSAQTGDGIDKLLECISLTSELLELRANPKRPGSGTVIEALQKKGEGNVVRLLNTNGTINRGDHFLCGHVFGKVKTIRDMAGKIINDAGPGTPCEITGLSELPQAGDQFHAVKDAARAKQLAEDRQTKIRDQRLSEKRHVNLENLLAQQNTGQLNLIVKADTQGTLEVLKKSIADLKHEEIEPKIIHAGVGGISETDITLADASDAVVLGFHVTDTSGARKLAEERGVDVRLYYVIYKLLEDLTEALEGRLAPEQREVITGHVEVRQTFKISRIGTIAGCRVMDGVIRRSSRVRLTRNGILIHEGKIETLKHLKDEVKEVKEGFECGILISGYDDVKIGDIIEPYEIESVKRSLGG